jgi:hypothetical protein
VSDPVRVPSDSMMLWTRDARPWRCAGGWGWCAALALTLMLSFQSGALAQPALPGNMLPQSVRFHLVSWHDRGAYNNANLGAALRWKSGLVAGGFSNSYGRPSWYGGIVVPAFEGRVIQLELMAGVITGYSATSPVDVVAVPSLGWRLSPRNSLQVVFMPRFVIPANALHVMFERRIGDSGDKPD